MQVIEAARSRCNHVMVINDGATDATPDLLKSVENEVILIGYSPNRGKGYALKTAFREAKKRGFDYVITMDSDGQHSVDDLPVFLDAIQQHPDSLLIGSRRTLSPISFPTSGLRFRPPIVCRTRSRATASILCVEWV